MKKQSYIRYFCLFVLFALLTIGDQVSKIAASSVLKNNGKKIIIKGLVSFEYLENRGAAWGILSGKTMLLTVITILFTLILFMIIVKIQRVITENKRKLFSNIQLVLVLLIAGSFGNLIDRLRFGYVVDFIQVEFIDFPIFNVADCYVTISALTLVVILLFFLKEEDIEEIKG